MSARIHSFGLKGLSSHFLLVTRAIAALTFMSISSTAWSNAVECIHEGMAANLQLSGWPWCAAPPICTARASCTAILCACATLSAASRWSAHTFSKLSPRQPRCSALVVEIHRLTQASANALTDCLGHRVLTAWSM
eukprot:CAMPEP_0203856332 /NCGR_PEP_ID=MMETSP0359-20131031/10114_1 /ASSEMBLY_ACC=CAM_ASM_000338 /TAXON_ID=268821 /ORGANISM="Scrippsiella Hangoei, Strain SHTV-5" /LENGTH=135 /DNA_ID=CAMNT_0050772925 /DNA_START=802 /DNA_END=1210 /DNA_ORIENTATION=-